MAAASARLRAVTVTERLDPSSSESVLNATSRPNGIKPSSPTTSSAARSVAPARTFSTTLRTTVRRRSGALRGHAGRPAGTICGVTIRLLPAGQPGTGGNGVSADHDARAPNVRDGRHGCAYGEGAAAGGVAPQSARAGRYTHDLRLPAQDDEVRWSRRSPSLDTPPDHREEQRPHGTTGTEIPIPSTWRDLVEDEGGWFVLSGTLNARDPTRPCGSDGRCRQAVSGNSPGVRVAPAITCVLCKVLLGMLDVVATGCRGRASRLASVRI